MAPVAESRSCNSSAGAPTVVVRSSSTWAPPTRGSARRFGRALPVAAAVGLLLGAVHDAAAQDAAGLAVSADPEREELVLRVGPVRLPANAMHHEVRQPAAQRAAVPVRGWIQGFDVEILDARGRPVPRAVLHHVNVIVPNERELFSPIMRRIAAAGRETDAVELPRLLGYPVGRGDSLLVTAMFHNPTDRSYERVYLRVRMPYTSADAWLDPISVYPFYVDVMPPASGHAYDLPPGRSERRWEGSPAVAGRILGVGGHLHDHAEKLVFEDVTTDEVIWEAEPIRGEDGRLVGMPVKTFYWTLGQPIRPDHVYRLTAIYDNPTGETIERGAMGALGGIFLPSDADAWPAADRTHPEYRLDVRLVTEGAYGDGGHGHGEEQGGAEDGDSHGGGGH